MFTPQKSRRQKAYVSLMGTTQLHLRAPWVIAWWSAAFPGFGHFLLSKYLRGALLFIWEVIINVQSNLNLGILYSFTGKIDEAKSVLDLRWLLLYAPVYIFGIWDSYRTSNDINNIYLLAHHEDAYIRPFRIGAIEINYLDKRSPKNSVMWSLLMPGLGQLYIHRILVTFFILIWWIALSYYSHLLPAIHYSLIGEIEKVRLVVNMEWLLFIPSLYGFAIYDAYANTVENNKLFDQDQQQFLKTHYQQKRLKLADLRPGGNTMHVISCFAQTIELEQAITALEKLGLTASNLIATPLERRSGKKKLFDSLHYSDGISLFDLGAILGTICMLLGVIYGFTWRISPIWAGLGGLGIGFFVGVLVDLLVSKRKRLLQPKHRSAAEVVLIIECTSDQLEDVENILWAHFAVGVSRLT